VGARASLEKASRNSNLECLLSFHVVVGVADSFGKLALYCLCSSQSDYCEIKCLKHVMATGVTAASRCRVEGSTDIYSRLRD
jgi:hypothetical protein